MANPGTVKTYDAKGCSIVLGGIIVNDFADGEFISITGMGGNFEAVIGADGSVNRNNKNVNLAIVTITVSQTSSTNDLFTTKHIADKLDNSGKGSFLFKDNNGTSVLSSGQAYIEGLPDAANGNSLGTRAWIIHCPNPVYNVGGNL